MFKETDTRIFLYVLQYCSPRILPLRLSVASVYTPKKLATQPDVSLEPLLSSLLCPHLMLCGAVPWEGSAFRFRRQVEQGGSWEPQVFPRSLRAPQRPLSHGKGSADEITSS